MYKISQWRNNIHSYYSRGDYFRRLLGEANMEILHTVPHTARVSFYSFLLGTTNILIPICGQLSSVISDYFLVWLFIHVAITVIPVAVIWKGFTSQV